MKKIIKKLKDKKQFIIIFVICTVAFIIGVLLPSILNEENRKIIQTSLNSFFDTIKNNQLKTNELLFKTLTSNIIIDLILWLLGISIIGIPIVIILLGYKSLSLGFTISSIISTYKLNGVIKALIYIVPNIINLFIFFVISYYSISFSLMLFNYLFRKKEYNKRIIVNRYLKLLVISIIILIFSSVIETYVVPKLFSLT
ncbi:MAG: stage II sporulation protein M [Bacilli bacterium]|nr:stage II sporulation protein M [Mycoplasmatota bacterium]MDD6263991.1 stage II sporulation protein M [bacterium]MDY2697764.1 stage II sporulation protein M [Bacilli bacterium]MDD6942146.1 stage II sporulation protein M [bacterium]MDY5992604.1 stage II sporulation protein M [Bacilli bacterium]